MPANQQEAMQRLNLANVQLQLAQQVANANPGDQAAQANLRFAQGQVAAAQAELNNLQGQANGMRVPGMGIQPAVGAQGGNGADMRGGGNGGDMRGGGFGGGGFFGSPTGAGWALIRAGVNMIKKGAFFFGAPNPAERVGAFASAQSLFQAARTIFEGIIAEVTAAGGEAGAGGGMAVGVANDARTGMYVASAEEGISKTEEAAWKDTLRYQTAEGPKATHDLAKSA